MKRLKKRFLFLALLPLVTGCDVAIGIVGIGGVVCIPLYLYSKTPEVEGVVKTDIESAEAAAMAAAEEMGVMIVNKERKEMGEIILKGSSLLHKKLDIGLVSFSNKMTKVQIWAKKGYAGNDSTYAAEILKNIEEKCRSGAHVGRAASAAKGAMPPVGDAANN